jgi:acyl carrier protein
MEAIKEHLKSYILNEFLPGEAPEALTDTTPLLEGGIIDSIATLKLVVYLEQHYNIQFDTREVDVKYFNKIVDLANLVRTKLKRT